MKRINIHITENQENILESVSTLTGLPRSEIIREAINSYVSKSDAVSDVIDSAQITYVAAHKSVLTYIEQLIKTNNIDTGLTNTKLYDYQRELITDIEKNSGVNNYLIHHSRQIGITTVNQAYVLAKSILTNNYKSILVNNKMSRAKHNMRDMVIKLEHIPSEARPGYKTRASSIIFDNGSQIDFISEAGLGNYYGVSDISFIYLDDAALFKNYKQSSDLAKAITSNNWGIVVTTSTDTRRNHEFIKDCIKHSNSDDGTKYIEYPYTVINDSGRDSQWVANTISCIGMKRFITEYCCRGGFINA